MCLLKSLYLSLYQVSISIESEERCPITKRPSESDLSVVASRTINKARSVG